MAVGDNYIVDFSEAIATLEKQLSKDDLPTFDLDPVKWRILEMFEVPDQDPAVVLERIIRHMLAHDWMYTKVEFVYTTPLQAQREKKLLDDYLHACLRQFGTALYFKLQELGLIVTGTERYKVIVQPSDYETYTLQRTQ
jgi:hypothetical protein